MKNITKIFIAVLFINLSIKAQNIGINGTGANANPSALLDIDASSNPSLGILIPRIALQAINLAAPVSGPATSLLVYNTATASTGTTAVSPGYYYWDGAKWVRFQYASSGTSSLDWSLTGNAGTVVGTNFIGTTDAQDMVVKTNGVERIRVLSGGNVGIGTTSPTRVFEVRNPALNPQLQVGTTSLLSNRGSILFGRLALWEVGSDISVNNSDNFFIAQASSGQYALAIDNNRNVGIGTTTPNTKLHIVTTATNTGFQLQDGTEGAGKFLTSDATGKASWKNASNTALVWNISRIIAIPNSGYYSITMYADDSAQPSAFTNSYTDATIVGGAYNGVALYNITTSQFVLANANSQVGYGVSCSGSVYLLAGDQIILGAQNWMSGTPAIWCLTVIPQ